MKKLFHPLGALAISALPFVLYSVWRTGYGVAQFFEARLLVTRYVWEVILLTSAVVTCCFCYRKGERKLFSIAAAVAIGAFLAVQATEEFPADYKHWIYVVAPIFIWSLLFSSTFVLAMRNEKTA